MADSLSTCPYCWVPIDRQKLERQGACNDCARPLRWLREDEPGVWSISDRD